MAQVTLVDRTIADGQNVILQLIRRGTDVSVAFWLKAPDDAWPHLYIASRLIDKEGPREGYRVLQEALEHLPTVSLSISDCKMIGSANHIAGAARMLLRKVAKGDPVHIRNGQISNVLAEEAFIYPVFTKEDRIKPASVKNSNVLGRVRLKQDIEEALRLEDRFAPLTRDEGRAMQQIVSSGMSPDQAVYWVQKKREVTHSKGVISAGTIGNARITAWWGDSPDDDPDPLVEVLTDDGRRGLTFRSNVELLAD